MDPTPPASPAPLRRLAGIAAGFAVVLAGVAALTWHHHRQQLPADGGEPFDLNVAMDLIGGQVPTNTESFYFFVLEPQGTAEAGELAGKLVQAAGEHEFIGITGADSGHNREVLLAALAAPRDKDLKGLVIIYAGPPEQESELRDVVSKYGAEFRFVVYSTVPATI